MAFRQFGGIEYNKKNNYVSSNTNNNMNINASEFVGQLNTKIVSRSHWDFDAQTLFNVGNIIFANGKSLEELLASITLSNDAALVNYIKISNSPFPSSFGNQSYNYPSKISINEYGFVTDIVAGTQQTGPTGPQGPDGPQGPTGLQGVSGIQGPTGLQGVSGIQGPPGLQGVSGIQGPAGLQGVSGIQGLQGIQGATGPTGPQGSASATNVAAFSFNYQVYIGYGEISYIDTITITGSGITALNGALNGVGFNTLNLESNYSVIANVGFTSNEMQYWRLYNVYTYPSATGYFAFDVSLGNSTNSQDANGTNIVISYLVYNIY